jgi:hypothetical protein
VAQDRVVAQVRVAVLAQAVAPDRVVAQVLEEEPAPVMDDRKLVKRIL